MGLKTKVIRAGTRIVIRAIAKPGTKGRKDPCETLRFCQEIKEMDAAELTKLARLWSDIAANGPPANDRKFKDLPGTDGLYEIKTSKLRVICFWDDGNLIVCTHGFVKKTQKTPKGEIDRAVRARKEYFNEKAKGTLQHDPVPRQSV